MSKLINIIIAIILFILTAAPIILILLFFDAPVPTTIVIGVIFGCIVSGSFMEYKELFHSKPEEGNK